MFGYPTQKVRVRSKHTPSDLLRSFFLNDRSPPRRPGGRRPYKNIPRTSPEPNELPHSTPLTRDGSFDGAQSRQGASEWHPRAGILESHTDPHISTRDLDTVSVTSSDSLSLPRAVVITGLEFAGTNAQRSLLQALSGQPFTLDDDPETVWKLPPDFIAVYVCVNDAWERPKIHPSLVNTVSSLPPWPLRN